MYKSNLCPGGGLDAPAQLIVGHVVRDGVGFCQQETVGALEGGDLAQGELLEELGRLVCLPEHEVLGDGDLGPAVLGSDQGLLGAEIVRIGVECLNNNI